MMRRFGLVAGPLLAALLYLWIPEALQDPAGGELQLGTAGRVTGALVGWMAIWWMTEAIPIFVTALLPVIVLPLTGAQDFFDTTAVYAHPLIFLALGGFVLALALERWDLHRRFATFVLRIVGNGPRRLVGGFMIVSAALSMWISNTAAAVIMLPIALSIIAADNEDADYHSRFRICLLLGTAYACSIGGMGTLIGTGTNVFLASFVESELQRDLSFAGWMRLGVPLVLVFLPLVWLLLTRVIFRLPAVAETDPRVLLPEQGPWSTGEKRALAVFCLAVVGWVGSPLLVRLPFFGNLSDPGVAMFCMLLLFLIPDGRGEGSALMDWDTAAKLPWGVLLLFGGGLALAGAIDDNGIGAALALHSARLQSVPPVLVVVFAVVLMTFLTELTSNLASTATLVPVFAAMADGMGIDPLAIIIPTALAAICAFMLPAATPPNSIVFGSGMLRIPDMVRAGIWINALGIVVISLLAYPLVGMLF
jgi:sodium-dependent dicarboxylate transporter 2/3/5